MSDHDGITIPMSPRLAGIRAGMAAAEQVDQIAGQQLWHSKLAFFWLHVGANLPGALGEDPAQDAIDTYVEGAALRAPRPGPDLGARSTFTALRELAAALRQIRANFPDADLDRRLYPLTALDNPLVRDALTTADEYLGSRHDTPDDTEQVDES